MKKIIAVAVSTLFFANLAFAQSCEEKAVSKAGKPLAGAAKTAFMKKCGKDNPAVTTAPVAADGKTTQQSKMTTCNADAKGKKGAERKAFMKECLSK